MGYMREAYTREYFLGRSPHGERLDYGAIGGEEWLAGGIHPEISSYLARAPLALAGKRILEIGFGRGESADYLLGEMRADSYVGIDFSDAAHQLALERLSKFDAKRSELILGDALEVMRARGFRAHFHAAFMLDVIEHIPNAEIAPLLDLILDALVPLGFLVVHTPFYGVDEDLIAQGDVYAEPSYTDLHPMTRGMHCNKFTRGRLLRLMDASRFTILNDSVYFRGLPIVRQVRNRFFLHRARRQGTL